MWRSPFLNLLPSSLFTRTLYHLHPPAVVDGLSPIMYFRLLLIVYEQKLLKYVFLAYADTDLSLLDIASYGGGSHFSSGEFTNSYSDYTHPPPLPHNSNILTGSYERRYSHKPSALNTVSVFSSSESRFPMSLFFLQKTSVLRLMSPN